jgi:hypothetical protein
LVIQNFCNLKPLHNTAHRSILDLIDCINKLNIRENIGSMVTLVGVGGTMQKVAAI